MKTDKIGGRALYEKLKDRGILVRHFGNARITDYIRITIGTDAQMESCLDAIEGILRTNPNAVVAIDEAYVDFGGESAYPLMEKYDNLIVVRTFSKSRSMAGGRLGYALGPAALMADLEKIKYATNPYNVNRLTLRLGEATVDAETYYQEKCAAIMATREDTAKALRELGFTVIPSKTNFLFVKTDKMTGAELYNGLKDRGILVRHFGNARICDYVRITIGTPEQMAACVGAITKLLEERQ